MRMALRLGTPSASSGVLAWQAQRSTPEVTRGLSHLFATQMGGRLHLTVHFGEQALAVEWLCDALAGQRLQQSLSRHAGCDAGPLTLISHRLTLDTVGAGVAAAVVGRA